MNSRPDINADVMVAGVRGFVAAWNLDGTAQVVTAREMIDSVPPEYIDPLPPARPRWEWRPLPGWAGLPPRFEILLNGVPQLDCESPAIARRVVLALEAFDLALEVSTARALAHLSLIP